ncbi:MAG: nucleotide exchange factor GrpE [Thermoleophilaceae bacterium]|nr:nucleotide exchange factor GrpE [Thermoleophilaceae bacterium]
MNYPEEHRRPTAEERPAAEERPTDVEDRPVAAERPAATGQRPEDEPVTSRNEAAEPGGDEDAANEEERLAQKEQSEQDDPLARAQRERAEYLDLARRTQAAFENYRKRAAKDAAAAGERAKGGLVRELLPVVDNLERALASAQPGEQHLAEGVRLVHAELIAVLERNGVEQFDPKGEAFDPVVHEALSTRSEDGADPGVVLDVIEKGYKANGTVLRPARVVVSG